MDLTSVELSKLRLAGSERLRLGGAWLLLGLKQDTRDARRLASAVQRLSVHTDGELPVVVVSGIGSRATDALVEELNLTVPVRLDDGGNRVLGCSEDCGTAFIAMILADRVVAVACADDPAALAGVAGRALRECGIDYLLPSRWLEPETIVRP